jgi:Leu/Phe-tRNA-protein transferase
VAMSVGGLCDGDGLVGGLVGGDIGELVSGESAVEWRWRPGLLE